MLTELSIRDIALIPSVVMRFGPGLNVLSGETGAGKSLIVGGLRLLCGERPPEDFVRSGAERGVVEGVFRLDPGGWIAGELAEIGIEIRKGRLVLRREIPLRGKGRVRANGEAITLSTLARASEILIDLHGQHDHQALLRRERQREALDDYAGVAAARLGFAQQLAEWKEAAARLREEIAVTREESGRQELRRFQLRELEAAAATPGELEALEIERGRLEQAELLRTTAARLENRLLEGEGSIHDELSELAAGVDPARTHDPAWDGVAESLRSLAIGAAELARDARALGERAIDDPARLEVVRERLRLLRDLLKKYGPEESDLFLFRERLRSEEADPEARDRRVSALRERVGMISDRLTTSGARLTRKRSASARRLRRAIESALAELGMEGTRFEPRVDPRTTGVDVGDGSASRKAGPSGFDAVEFLLAPNRGEEARPLRRIASGGEISRIMLALKSVLGESRGTATMAFDEIDLGVGGRVAGRVAETLASIAARRQVLCVTHLAVIASRASVHLRVSKDEVGGRTITRVEPVEGEERVREIARMLGGEETGGVVVEHARELLAGEKP